MSEPRPLKRIPALIALAVVLVGVGVADRADRDPLTPEGQRLATAFAPTASPPDALTSTWYCAAGTAAPGGVAESTVVIYNPTGKTLEGDIEVIGGDGQRVRRPVNVEPRSRVAANLYENIQNPYVAAVVRFNGGGAIVEHSGNGPAGTSSGPCASSASTHWYVPEGATTRAATLIYALFNPFPDDAIVDLSFSTDQGRDAPAAFQGIVVPANSLMPVDIGSHVRRRAHVSGVAVARRGRIVLEALQVHNGDGRKGVALTLGAPRTATSFVFPDGIAGGAQFEQLHLFNPTNTEAAVQLDLVLDSAEAEPFELRVPPHDRVTIDLTNESRVPKDVGHALIVRVSNGVPIAVGRTIDVGPANSRRGYISDLGATAAAEHWGFAAGGTSPQMEQYVSILNEADRDVTITVTTPVDDELAALPNLSQVRLKRGARLSFRLADHNGQPEMPLIVNASGPVVVERTNYRQGATGAAASMGVVLSTDHG